MESTRKERLQKVIFEEADGNVKKFAESIGLTRADRIYNVLKGKNDLSEKLSLLIINKYKNYSLEWMMSGVKESNIQDILVNNNGNQFQQLDNGSYLMKVPLIEIDAQAGFADNYNDVEYISEVNTYHSLIVSEPHRGKYLAFRVKGDSMDDGSSESILPLSIVAVRELQRVHWKDKIRYNQFPYWVIAHTESSFPLLKKITNHDVNKGIITCHSLNTSPEYKDFELNINEMTALFYVVDISRSISNRINYLKY